jgi:hypothetical protein
MKTIQPVSIWDNGADQNATVLNAYAADVTLNVYATFNYSLFGQTVDGDLSSCLRQGVLNMTGEAYQLWQSDSYAWEWVAEQLNLTITGDYIKPVPPEPTTTTTTSTEVPEPTTSTTTSSAPSTTSTTSTVK